jgi:hypothetical protein
MARHLWERHRRLLVGRRVRKPWRSIERWALRSGAVAAHRRLLRMGGLNNRSLSALGRVAEQANVGLCPHCFAAIPLDAARFPAAADVEPLNLSHGRLSGHGYVVELTGSLAGPRLRIETPAGILFDGPVRNGSDGRGARRFRFRLGAFALFVVTLVLAGILPPPMAVLATLFILLAALWTAVAMRRHETDDRPDSVIDHAWRLLVPRVKDDAAFVAALAAASPRHGDPCVRERRLPQIAGDLRSALKAGAARPMELVALHSLQVADAAATGGDPVFILADAVQSCFTGALTPLAADLLFAGGIGGRSRGELARLRVLLAARAFATGFGVWDLHALGQAVPGLGRVVNVDDTDGLARLRLIWDQRSTRPWRQCGPAATVFELANYPMLGGQHLEAAPDLLLFQPLPTGGEPVHLLACGRGLIVGGGLIHAWPTPIDTRPLPGSKGGGNELRFGPHAIQVHGDVAELVRKITNWADYWFEEFLPWIGNALTRAGDGRSDSLEPLRVRCPECGETFLGRRGELGRKDFAESSRPSAPDSA